MSDAVATVAPEVRRQIIEEHELESQTNAVSEKYDLDNLANVYNETGLAGMVCDYPRLVAHLMLEHDDYALNDEGEWMVRSDGEWCTESHAVATRIIEGFYEVMERVPGKSCFIGYDANLLDEVGFHLYEQLKANV